MTEIEQNENWACKLTVVLCDTIRDMGYSTKPSKHTGYISDPNRMCDDNHTGYMGFFMVKPNYIYVSNNKLSSIRIDYTDGDLATAIVKALLNA